MIRRFLLRDRPFNLQGGYGFLFRSTFFFRTTRELEYLFFLWLKARFFFSEFNIRLYDKNSESYFFFSSTKIRIFCSARLGIRNPIFASQGLRFGSPFSPPLADLEYILKFARNATWWFIEVAPLR